jgi:nucleoside-diphosphate-sugar epimerase
VARVLIVGCGCRGQALARALRAEGHAVRGTSRAEAGRGAIEAAGAEFHRGDPDRIATLAYALDNATVLCWLMGSARGPPQDVAALHSTRLAMLLDRTIDTTVRGVVYEAAGSAAEHVLNTGAATVRRACRRSAIPYRLLRADPGDPAGWVGHARRAVAELVGSRAWAARTPPAGRSPGRAPSRPVD